MTRKDYRLIAKALFNVRKCMNSNGEVYFVKVLAELLNALAQDNSRFDRQKFVEAVFTEKGVN